jgi:ABC-type lipoprotein release transport system permease subunit
VAIPLIYNIRNVAQRPVATFATALGIGLVVAILVGALALAAGFQAALIQTGSRDNAIVLRVGADSEISSGLSLDQANIIRVLPEIATDPQGRPLVSSELLVLTNLDRQRGQGSSNVPIRGITQEGMALRGQVKIVEGRWFAPGSDELIVGRRIARRFEDCGIGDRMRFGQRDFTVVGHFDAGGSSFDSEVWGDQTVLGPAFQRDGYQSITFRMRDPSQLAALEKQLEGDPRLGVQVLSERTWYANQSQLLGNIIRFAGVFITLIMAVGAIFGALNTMYAAVGARTREIAVLLTLGFSPWAVMVSFVIESVIIAIIGGVIGCLLALPINGITTSTTNWSSFSELAFAFRVTPNALLVGMIFAVLIGLAGGFFPARRAAKQKLATTLRGG